MAKTLLDGFWYDRGMGLNDLRKEIECVDKVINLRIGHALKARKLGLTYAMLGVDKVDTSRLVDDLLLRRKCLLDLVRCLELEENLDPATSGELQALIRMISRKRCDRFV